MNEPTITVESYFGEKQLTREEFVERWRSHATELLGLSSTTELYNELSAIRDRVVEIADAEFTRLLEKEVRHVG